MDKEKAIIKKPISWDQFLLLEDEEQEAYLQYIIKHFHVAGSLIAQDLFHVSHNTLYRHITKKRFDIPKSLGGRIPEAVLKNWRDWIAGRSSDFERASGPIADNSNPVDVSAEVISSILREMEERYGDIRVTITIEPK